MSNTYRLAGHRVILRLLVETDLADYEQWNDNSRSSMQTDGPWYDEDVSKLIAGRRRWLAGERKAPYRFLEIEMADGAHIGWVNLYRQSDDPHLSECGIHIAEHDYWGCGLGSEAFALWVNYLFEAWELRRLGLTTWSGNPGMIRLAEKLGFVLEGTIRQGCEVNGAYYDIVKYGMLRTEWEVRKPLLVR